MNAESRRKLAAAGASARSDAREAIARLQNLLGQNASAENFEDYDPREEIRRAIAFLRPLTGSEFERGARLVLDLVDERLSQSGGRL